MSKIALITDTKAAYLAGLFDGEGSIHLSRNRTKRGFINSFGLQVTVVVSTYKPIIDFVTDLLGYNNIEPINNKRPECKPAWRIHIYSKKALEFLELVSPYVIIKKRQTELAIKFQQGKTPLGARTDPNRFLVEQEAKFELTELNRRGVQLV